MIDKDQEELAERDDSAGHSSAASASEMAEALKSIKSASPSLAGDIDAAQVTPESLAGSHGRATPDDSATSEEHGTAKHAAPE